ncbi:cobyrinate a,c-diamide synthase [Candidatus Entotheonella palauensis]|uniref:cobyrinate a,c-diamide synthase n=1 Tax=Candidatus Entotheonella palauensis TaxID=93172 RepID=UPI000B7E10D3|nr:cobyrinate a,c-diamide synthase [Candidatus Entotheonella palauensis]
MNGPKAVVIAGAASGVGKTTVAAAIMGALTERGYKVQPFKVGPDYIDPSYHSAVCGFPCRNLDSWLLTPEAIQELFHRAMAGKDVAVIEGVMGLYDGANGDDDAGSTAQLAKLLGAPVVLVLDASKSSRSVGAMALGFNAFDPEVNLAGVILNGIAGGLHLDLARPSLDVAGVPCLGYLPSRGEFTLPERHLGLIPTAEGHLAEAYYQDLAQQAADTVDLDRLLAIAAHAAVPDANTDTLFPEVSVEPVTAIAVAMDKAFNFYYPDSLDLLTAWGAELVPFSLLEDRALPPQVNGIYMGGGFPEMFAEPLCENAGMRASIRAAAERGLPIYAECGGLMYLGHGIEDAEGRYYEMAGVLPGRSTMQGARLTLGYRSIRAIASNCLLAAGETVRGHEFHFSSLKHVPGQHIPGKNSSGEPPSAYEILDQPGRSEGFVTHNILASYIHIHMGSKASLAPRFVATCTRRNA